MARLFLESPLEDGELFLESPLQVGEAVASQCVFFVVFRVLAQPDMCIVSCFLSSTSIAST